MILECLKELASLQCVLVRTESRKAEVACAVLAESFAWCADDSESVKDGIEEFPAAHVVRALEPDVRRINAACKGDSLSCEYFCKSSSVALVVCDVCFAVF